MREEREQLKHYIARQGLKFTRQRAIILEVFLDSGGHLNAEELHQAIARRKPAIGLATVYRTMNLLCACGIAEAVEFGDGQTRYERSYGQEHHDHLICTECAAIIEFEDPQIEKLQEEMARRHGFEVQAHSLKIYGLCPDCRKTRRS